MSNPRQILYGEEARARMMVGVQKLANAVRVTMGPRGRNVMFKNKYGNPVITNDGVTIANEVFLEDEFENMGAQLVKEVANKTNDVAGDGTTAATVLAHAIISSGLKAMKEGANPTALKRGIDKAVQEVVKQLKKIAKPITSPAEIMQVACISSQDQAIGKIISELMAELGNDGVIIVEESPTFGIEKKIVEGMQFDSGYISPYMVTDTARMEAVIMNPKILLTDKRLNTIDAILPILEKVAKAGCKEIVIVADNVEGSALATMVMNKLNGAFNMLAVCAPSFGENRAAMMQDIAILTGATYISNDVGIQLENAELAHLGTCEKIVVARDNTMIVKGGGSPEAIAKRVEEVRALIPTAQSSWEEDQFKKRLARLTGGVGVILVGAATGIELKEKKYRIEDALNATRAAIEEGIVAGGGMALLQCLDYLKDFDLPSNVESIGLEIIKEACMEPMKQIASNAGKDGQAVVVQVLAYPEGGGYDAEHEEFLDMIEMGIIDPTKVVRSALENAASLAGMFLTMECAMVDIPSKEPKQVLIAPKQPGPLDEF